MQKKEIRAGLLFLVLASFLLPLVAGCAPSQETKPAGYVDAGPNAKPAKKGKGASASSDL